MFTKRSKHGGLDTLDQSRSRSRTSFVSRLTFENRREYPSRRDQLFFFSVKILKIEIFQSRFIFVEIFIEIVETNRDCQDFRDLSRLFEIFEICCNFSRFIKISRHYWDFLRYFRIKNLDKLRNLDREIG